jgi:hypothetical protein
MVAEYHLGPLQWRFVSQMCCLIPLKVMKSCYQCRSSWSIAVSFFDGTIDGICTGEKVLTEHSQILVLRIGKVPALFLWVSSSLIHNLIYIILFERYLSALPRSSLHKLDFKRALVPFLLLVGIMASLLLLY